MTTRQTCVPAIRFNPGFVTLAHCCQPPVSGMVIGDTLQLSALIPPEGVEFALGEDQDADEITIATLSPPRVEEEPEPELEEEAELVGEEGEVPEGEEAPAEEGEAPEGEPAESDDEE